MLIRKALDIRNNNVNINKVMREFQTQIQMYLNLTTYMYTLINTYTHILKYIDLQIKIYHNQNCILSTYAYDLECCLQHFIFHTHKHT